MTGGEIKCGLIYCLGYLISYVLLCIDKLICDTCGLCHPG
jgi:hypothetical protein